MTGSKLTIQYSVGPLGQAEAAWPLEWLETRIAMKRASHAYGTNPVKHLETRSRGASVRGNKESCNMARRNNAVCWTPREEGRDSTSWTLPSVPFASAAFNLCHLSLE